LHHLASTGAPDEWSRNCGPGIAGRARGDRRWACSLTAATPVEGSQHDSSICAAWTRGSRTAQRRSAGGVRGSGSLGRAAGRHRRAQARGAVPAGAAARSRASARRQRVPLPPVVDLRLLPVTVRVVHGVGPEPVGASLQEDRAPAVAHQGHGALGGRPDLHHIHAVARPGRDLVARRLHREVGLRLRPIQCRAHRVQVVLAEEEDRQVPPPRPRRPRPARRPW
jgi:hypothetical protein